MDNPYLTYTLEELATDPCFRSWVLNPTQETTIYWHDMLQRHPEKASHIYEAKSLVNGIYAYFDQGTTDLRKVNLYFEEVVRKKEHKSSPGQASEAVQKFSYKKWALIASVLLLIGTFTGFWQNQQNEYQTYTTAFGEWETITLPDGSRVKLNANSELKLARDWSEKTDRKVWLKGEAYFQVEKKPATGAKFYVMTGEVAVEVLGTSFNVNKRGEKTEVFLEEGKIKLETGTEETLMIPGDFIAYSANSQRIIERRKNVNDLHSSWKDGVLMMKEKSVQEIFNKIEEIYGVEFQVGDLTLLESKTTVRIPMDKLKIALPILEKALKIDTELIENQIIVK